MNDRDEQLDAHYTAKELREGPEDIHTPSRFQVVFRWTSYITFSFLALAVVLDTASDSISLIKSPLAYIASGTLAASWVIAEFVVRRNPIRWITRKGQTIQIRSLSDTTRFILLITILLIWTPLIADNIQALALFRSLPIACYPAPQNNRSGHIAIADMQLIPVSPQVGQVVTATFKVRNESTGTVAFKRLIAGGRGPNADTLGWGASEQDFPPVDNFTMEPGEECIYAQSRSFTQPGAYFVEPTMLATNGQWGGIRPYSRIPFVVQEATTNK